MNSPATPDLATVLVGLVVEVLVVGPGRDLSLRDVRRTDAHALLLGCHDGALLKFRPVTTENSATHRPLIMCTQVHESHDSSMWTSIQHRQLAEVLVERDQCLSVRGCF